MGTLVRTLGTDVKQLKEQVTTNTPGGSSLTGVITTSTQPQNTQYGHVAIAGDAPARPAAPKRCNIFNEGETASKRQRLDNPAQGVAQGKQMNVFLGSDDKKSPAKRQEPSLSNSDQVGAVMETDGRGLI
ncbi:expressed unknown protein [Seminavis robusta]|uniref:Uncharacterized protein n=1 Tax=Seminavis robusta TaxID=568900 RepID=A0A9N8EZY5_9STRA|nr:expressed unknown protein [Seminavis robusta]|eukprot:Sro2501_g329440.1 n/a (130) ;mRNA; f:10079-10468